jgi:hypothetical protein
MTQSGTYRSLIMLEKDIREQAEASAAFAFFHKDKIKNFYDKNARHLTKAKEVLNELLSEHVKVEDGKFVRVEENGRWIEWVYHTEADRDEYQIKYEAFLNRQIDIRC